MDITYLVLTGFIILACGALAQLYWHRHIKPTPTNCKKFLRHGIWKTPVRVKTEMEEYYNGLLNPVDVYDTLEHLKEEGLAERRPTHSTTPEDVMEIYQYRLRVPDDREIVTPKRDRLRTIPLVLQPA